VTVAVRRQARRTVGRLMESPSRPPSHAAPGGGLPPRGSGRITRRHSGRALAAPASKRNRRDPSPRAPELVASCALRPGPPPRSRPRSLPRPGPPPAVVSQI